MLPAAIALSAALVAAAAAVVLGLVSKRRARRLEAQLRTAFAEVASFLQRLSRELAEAQDRFEHHRQLEHSMSNVLAAADLEGLLHWTAETAAELSGAAGCLVQVPDEGDGAPGVAAHGLPADGGLNRLVVWPPDGPRAVWFTLEYGPTPETPVSLRSGLAVPFQPDAADAFIAVFSSSADPLPEPVIVSLETLAALAWPAIVRLRREERREPGRADALTGLGARCVFHDSLAREVASAHWRETPLALIVLDVDDFRTVNERLGVVNADMVLAEVARRVVRAVEESEATSCRIGSDEFGVILPNATTIDAESVFAGVQASLRHTPPEHLTALAVSAGVAELRTEEDPMGVFERAHHALRDAKRRGKGTAVVANGIRVGRSL
jgi:diguanylate cyclase (GGDEF)-like protein